MQKKPINVQASCFFLFTITKHRVLLIRELVSSHFDERTFPVFFLMFPVFPLSLNLIFHLSKWNEVDVVAVFSL